jgi:hypothetical protein
MVNSYEKGTSAESKGINSFLDTLQGKAHAIHRSIIQEGKIISVELFKERWFGITEKLFLTALVFGLVFSPNWNKNGRRFNYKCPNDVQW